jgi:hypothetical protein
MYEGMYWSIIEVEYGTWRIIGNECGVEFTNTLNNFKIDYTDLIIVCINFTFLDEYSQLLIDNNGGWRELYSMRNWEDKSLQRSWC